MVYMVAMIDGFVPQGENSRYLIKIGYSRDLSARMKQYNSHAPGVRLIATCPGTTSDEKEYQEWLLSQPSCWASTTEWTYVNDDALFMKLCEQGFAAVAGAPSDRQILHHKKAGAVQISKQGKESKPKRLVRRSPYCDENGYVDVLGAALKTKG